MRAVQIPTVDVSGLTAGDPAARLACGRAIGAACRDIGFFQAVGHGLDPALLGRVFAMAHAFFAQPTAAKMAVAMSAATGFHGYFPLAGEVTDPAIGGDPKEGFDVGSDMLSASGRPETGGLWPSRPDGFAATLGDYYAAMCRLGRLLSRGFAVALGLDEAFFAAALDHPTAILRVLHYPALPDPERSAVGCGAHSDYGYLTMLAQDAEGGLQVQTRAGDWVDVQPADGAFVCNVGEMMARWTNDVFRATPHRVVRLSPRSRYSIPFFFHPNPNVLIAPLPTCIPAAGTPLYAPILSGDYLHARQSGAYVPTAA